MTVKLKGTITIPIERLDHMMPLLATHVLESRKEDGNIRFEITQDEKDPEIFHLEEEFTDEEAFAFHKTRSEASPWGKQSTDLERNFSKTSEFSLFNEDD